MSKHISIAIIMTSFLCNMHMHSQDATTVTAIDSVLQGISHQNFNKRASLIDPKTKTQTRSEISHSSNTATEEPKDADYIELTRQKLGFDPKPFLSAGISFASAIATAYHAYHSNHVATGSYSLAAIVFAWVTHCSVSNNSEQSCGETWLRRPVKKLLVTLTKNDDGAWIAQYQTSQPTSWTDIYLNMSDPKPLKVSKEIIEELASEILKNHDANVEQKDLYTSHVFKKDPQ